MNNNEACAEYFRGNSAYRRCFSEFEKKWKTYGKVTGIITLKNTSEEERRAIGGILGKTFYENTIRFPFAEFEKGLQYTKFAPVDFEQVLEAYFGRKMLTTQERQKEAERGKADFFETVELSDRVYRSGFHCGLLATGYVFSKKVWLSDSNQRIWKGQRKDRKTVENCGKGDPFAGRYSRDGRGISPGGIFRGSIWKSPLL